MEFSSRWYYGIVELKRCVKRIVEPIIELNNAHLNETNETYIQHLMESSLIGCVPEVAGSATQLRKIICSEQMIL